MNVKQLETFLWIARLGSFSSAAPRLFTTQSNVSARMRELERDLGVELFARSGHRVSLSAKGRALLPYAEQIIQLMKDVRQHIGDPTSYAWIIRVGIAEMIAATWLPKLLAAVREQYPLLCLEISINLGNQLLPALWDGDLDLILTPSPIWSGEPTGLVLESLGHVDLAWMASPKLKLPKSELGPKELGNLPIITLSRQSNIRRMIETWLGGIPLQESIVVNNNNVSVVAAMIKAGVGISILPLAPYREDISAGHLQILQVKPKVPQLELLSIMRQDCKEPLTHAIAELAKSVSQIYYRSQRPLNYRPPKTAKAKYR